MGRNSRSHLLDIIVALGLGDFPPRKGESAQCFRQGGQQVQLETWGKKVNVLASPDTRRNDWPASSYLD